LPITVQGQWNNTANSGNSDSNNVGPVFISPIFKTDIHVTSGQYSSPITMQCQLNNPIIVITYNTIILGTTRCQYVYFSANLIYEDFIKFLTGILAPILSAGIQMIMGECLKTFTILSQTKNEANNIRSYSNNLWPIYISKILWAIIQIIFIQYSFSITM
jgi:hypothetical protein